MELSALPPAATVYLAPDGLTDAVSAGPAGRPLAGGPLVFTALRLIAAEGGRRVFEVRIEAADFERRLAELAPPHAERAQALFANLVASRPPLAIPGQDRPLGFGKPLVMGILNVTPDSFSDGGRFAGLDAAVSHGMAMIAAGADIIDIGGESTRPGAYPLFEGDEIRRVVPVIEALRGKGAVLSLDTRKAEVMKAGLEAGAQLINDVSALTYDDVSLSVATASGAPAVLMHSQGDPQTMQDSPRYDDVILDVFDALEERIAAAEKAGLTRNRVIADPGIGFGKTVAHNLKILDQLAFFHGLGCPVMLGASRKRFIGALDGEAPAMDRFGGSIAAACAGLAKGVQILRVHDVRETVQAVAMFQGLRDVSFIPC